MLIVMILMRIWLVLSLSVAAPVVPAGDKEAREDTASVDIVNGDGIIDIVNGDGIIDIVNGDGIIDIVDGDDIIDIVNGDGIIDIVDGDGINSDALHSHSSENTNRYPRRIHIGGDVSIDIEGNYAHINLASIFGENAPASPTSAAVDGGWSNWSEYGQCSKECGGGQQTRTRTCTNPVPQHNGRSCEQQNIGNPTETKDCNLHDCAIDGGWTSFGECTTTCKGGVQKRTCTDPHPQHGGKQCTGGDTQPCNEDVTCTETAVDGGWSNWSEYGQCSKECGGGQQTRTRTCTNPVPQHKGRSCEQQNIGNPTETKDCNLHDCATCDGTWEFGVEYNGNDIGSCSGTNEISTPEACQRLCQKVSGCVGWEWGFDKDNCCVKSKLGNRKTGVTGRVAGRRNSCKTVISDLKPTVESSKDFSHDYRGSLLLENSCEGKNPSNYWLSPGGKTGEEASIILNLGRVAQFNRFNIKNTHNGHSNDRGAKNIGLYTSNSKNGKWNLVAEKLMADARNKGCNVPVEEVTIGTTNAQFIKLVINSYYGYGGGLQYLGVDRVSEATILAGTWSVAFTNEARGTFTIKPDGEISFSGRNTLLKPSDDQINFPSSEGWMKSEKLMRDTTWSYYRIAEYGTLKVEHFYSGGPSKLKNLDDYCCSGIGHRQGTYKKMEYSSFCSGSWARITSEATCRAAAAALNLKWGQSWDGPGKFPGCLHTKDSRNGVYFNTSPKPSNNPNADYAEICQVQAGCKKEDNYDYSGNDIENKKTTGEEECANWCGAVKECKAWTLTKSNNWCWIKSSDAGRSENNLVISGTKGCATGCSPHVTKNAPYALKSAPSVFENCNTDDTAGLTWEEYQKCIAQLGSSFDLPSGIIPATEDAYNIVAGDDKSITEEEWKAWYCASGCCPTT